jgi:menaquinone-dependent protoporphyrinogen IX oxidase
MRTLIIFYSRTGNTKKAADALAARMGADLAEIRCDRYRTGFLSYLTAGLDSLTGRLPAITLPPQSASDYDLVVIGGPLWTHHLASPILTFLRTDIHLPPKVALLVTRDVAPPESAFAEMQALLRNPAVAKLALTSGGIKRGTIGDEVQGFADKLRTVA